MELTITPPVLFADSILQGVFIGLNGVLYNYTMAMNFWVVTQKPATTNAVAAG